jgi:glycosyltransferase involved in cell wall biosynthesis
MTAVAESQKDQDAVSRDPVSLRVLRVADVPNVATAGMSGYMLSSAEALERRGHQVAFRFRSDFRLSATNSGVRRLLVPWLIVATVIAARLRGERFDVVEIHEPLSGVYAVVARLLRRWLPACVVLSHGLEERGWLALLRHERLQGRRVPLKRRVLVPSTLLSQARLGLKNAAGVMLLSTEDREFAVGRLGVPAERVSLAYGGVAPSLFTTPRAARGHARILFLGSWIERKGTIELTEAWRLVSAAHPEATLTIAGVGDGDRARDELGSLERVEVIDAVSRDELPALFARHDVYVLPSYFEGLPLSMVEAAAGGLACVVSSVCGNLDVFRADDPQRDGALLVPPHDHVALRDALVTLIADEELRWTLGGLARERARAFTWAHNAEQVLAAYNAAIERWRLSAPG